jgi:hypothetical protein
VWDFPKYFPAAEERAANRTFSTSSTSWGSLVRAQYRPSFGSPANAGLSAFVYKGGNALGVRGNRIGTPRAWGGDTDAVHEHAECFVETRRHGYHSEDQQQRGKPKPPGSRAQHGTRTNYFYGCRCAPCAKAESDYQCKRREAKKAALVAEEG